MPDAPLAATSQVVREKFIGDQLKDIVAQTVRGETRPPELARPMTPPFPPHALASSRRHATLYATVARRLGMTLRTRVTALPLLELHTC